MKSQQRKLIILFFSALTLFLASHLFNNSKWFHPSLQKQAEHFQEKLVEKETALEQKLDELVKSTELTGVYNTPASSDYKDLFSGERMLFFIYEDDELQFWSNNSVQALNELTPRRNYEAPLQKLSNGWYLSKMQQAGNKTYVGLLLIKNEYPFENKYLQNSFNPCLGMDDGFEIGIEQAQEHSGPNEPGPIAPSDQDTVKSKNGTALFTLVKANEKPHVDFHQAASIILFFAGLCLLLLFFYGIFKNNTIAKLILFPAVVLLIRASMLYFHYPPALYSLPLFDPAYHGSSDVFPSLGDFLFNILTSTLLIFYLSQQIRFKKGGNTKTGLAIAYGAVLLLSVMCLHFPVSYLLERLILDSDIDFTINNLFTLTLFSYAGLFITWLLLLAWYFVFNRIVESFPGKGIKEKLFSYLISLAVFGLIGLIAPGTDWNAMGITALICGGMLLFSERKKISRTVFSAAALLLGFSIYAAYSVAGFYKEKVEGDAKIFAEQLAAEQDPIAEYTFTEVAEEVKNDRLLRNAVTLLPEKQNEFFARLEQKFLNDYLQKYEVRINVFSNADSLIASDNTLERTLDFYEALENAGRPTSGKSLLYCYDINNQVNYLGKIIFTNSRDTLQKQTTVYLELEEKISKNELGFPELLLDKDVEHDKNTEDYSFAVYRDGKIVSAYGDFNYSEDEPSFQVHHGQYEFRSSGNWRHLFFKPSVDDLILLSRPQPTGFQKLTGVSFLFLFYAVLLLLGVGGYSLLSNKRFATSSFRNRLNISVISILTVFLILIGFATIYYVGAEYRNKNVQAISEKIRSVTTEIENRATRKANFYEDTDQLGYTLNKFSKVFFTDINLYNTNGDLIVSTRPRLFDIGLVSEKINPEAGFSMRIQKKTMYVHNENIGKLTYLSAYAPLVNSTGETVAYLNLPYFARQNGLQKEILALLSALVNIYVLLIILAVGIALFISRKITEPFEVIGKNIQQVKLGRENKPIEWNSDDEIGRLVIEYNKMIQKLGESAETLAKSERESAWREMARQVAHEIKNPLTPMKLSVQHLQRAYKEQSPGWDKNIERMARTMIEQIDTLAHIASEFSNFAKMPRANNERLIIADVLTNVVELYRETENCSFTMDISDNDLVVFADREQLQRVFNNLVKNAIQSIPEGREGDIRISLEGKGSDVLIQIADNGTGISEEMKDKIFTPNFTTKSTGMGLGLAMVKNIVENNAGSIWFETEEGKGTVFFVKLPVIKD